MGVRIQVVNHRLGRYVFDLQCDDPRKIGLKRLGKAILQQLLNDMDKPEWSGEYELKIWKTGPN